MNIYLIRHSKAEPSSTQKKDSERELTVSGMELINLAVGEWKLKIDTLDYIFTSPFTRAIQTANAIAADIKTKNDIIIEKSLSPGCNTDAIIKILTTIEEENTAFVGHQPDISFIISRFISSYDVNLKFSPATIAKLSFSGKPIKEKGKLEFLLPPPG
jgi:phosphohistidine phosphatase